MEFVHFDLVYVNMMMINFNNPHLTNWFCGLMYDPITIFKMISESSPKSIGHLLSGFHYRVTHHLYPHIMLNSAGRKRCIKKFHSRQNIT